jgi:molecular chaperone Hsp33
MTTSQTGPEGTSPYPAPDPADVIGQALAAMPDDRVLPFTVEALDVRGRIARIGPALDAIVHRHAYPEPVARVLGEAVALTALLGTALKFDGRFQLQTKTDGAIEMLVVDFDAPDRIRAMARYDVAQIAEAVAANLTSTAVLLGSGYLGMTVDQGSHASRYQGVVELDGTDGLEEAGHRYFRQSEQIPTRLRLATARVVGSHGESWRAGGIMVQFLPTSPDRKKQQDLHPGDDPNGTPAPERDADGVDDDAWAEARALVETVADHELVDPMLESERLIWRLFHERGARVFEPQAVREQCRCSADSILAMLRRFTTEDRREMVADDGAVRVTCEFCSQVYRFLPGDIEARDAAR